MWFVVSGRSISVTRRPAGLSAYLPVGILILLLRLPRRLEGLLVVQRDIGSIDWSIDHLLLLLLQRSYRSSALLDHAFVGETFRRGQGSEEEEERKVEEEGQKGRMVVKTLKINYSFPLPLLVAKYSHRLFRQRKEQEDDVDVVVEVIDMSSIRIFAEDQEKASESVR